jgi:LysM repeat protein
MSEINNDNRPTSTTTPTNTRIITTSGIASTSTSTSGGDWNGSMTSHNAVITSSSSSSSSPSSSSLIFGVPTPSSWKRMFTVTTSTTPRSRDSLPVAPTGMEWVQHPTTMEWRLVKADSIVAPSPVSRMIDSTTSTPSSPVLSPQPTTNGGSRVDTSHHLLHTSSNSSQVNLVSPERLNSKGKRVSTSSKLTAFSPSTTSSHHHSSSIDNNNNNNNIKNCDRCILQLQQQSIVDSNSGRQLESNEEESLLSLVSGISPPPRHPGVVFGGNGCRSTSIDGTRTVVVDHLPTTFLALNTNSGSCNNINTNSYTSHNNNNSTMGRRNSSSSRNDDDWELLSDRLSLNSNQAGGYYYNNNIHSSSTNLPRTAAGSVRSIGESLDADADVAVDDDQHSCSFTNLSIPFKIQRTTSSSTIDSSDGAGSHTLMHSYVPRSKSHTQSSGGNGILGVDYVEHVVLPSDTLQGICLAYKISSTQLKQANHFSGNSLVLAPKKVIIPITKQALRQGYIRIQDVESKEYKIHAFLAEFTTHYGRTEAKAYVLLLLLLQLLLLFLLLYPIIVDCNDLGTVTK